MMETLITQPWYLFLKDLLTFIFTLAGLVIAGLGLVTWKKQIHGTKKFEATYNLHYSLLKLRDAIKHVRNPAIFPSEEQEALRYSKTKHPERTDENIEKNSQSYVYEMRWEKIAVAYTEMESHLLAAEVLWGSHILTLIKPLKEKVTELNVSLQQKFRPEFATKDPAEIDEVVYYAGSWYENEGDAFSKQVAEIIKKISDYMKTRIG